MARLYDVRGMTMDATAIHPVSGISDADEKRVTRFLHHEARLLDEDMFKDWLALFADECFYWLPLEKGQENGFDTISLIFDDRKLLETRVRRVTHAWFHAQTPKSRLMHFVTNIVVDRTGDGFTATSQQLIAEHRLDRVREYHAKVTHDLIEDGEQLRIRQKRIDLIDSEGEHRGIAILL